MDGMPTPSKHSRHPILASLGAAIRRRRKEQGMSQERLAQAVGMDRSYIGQVERGENSIAILPLAAVAKALDTTIASLMTSSGL